MSSFAGNFSKDKRFAKSNWLCECKRSSETEAHILEGKCEAYFKIKEKCLKMKTENYGKQSYLKDKNIGASRNHYTARYRMSSFAGNFSKDKRFAKSN